MTRADILRMAGEAGMGTHLAADPGLGLPGTWVGPTPDVLERFAALVAAAEREGCAQLCDARAEEYLSRSLRRQHHHGAGLGASICADAIRKRGAA